jgi:hypothetical protein
MEEAGRKSTSKGYIAGYLQDAIRYSEDTDEVVWLYVLNRVTHAASETSSDAVLFQQSLLIGDCSFLISHFCLLASTQHFKQLQGWDPQMRNDQ